MRLRRFLLEGHIAANRPAGAVSLSSSDVEPLRLAELLALGDEEAVGDWEQQSLGYGPTRGRPDLRGRIARRLGASVTEEHVHVFGGTTEAVFATVASVISPGDEVIVVGPAYQLLVDLPSSLGAVVRTVEMRHDRQWALDVDEVRSALSARTRLLICNFPNNPTGALPDQGAFVELLALAESHGVIVLSDEIYRGVEPGAQWRLPPAVSVGAHAVSVSGLSKTHGLAGLRVGWVAARNPGLLDRLRTFRYWSTLSGSVPSEALAVMALDAEEQLLDRARALVAANADRLSRFVARHADSLDLVPARGGTTAFPRLLRHDAQQLTGGLARRGVFAVPSQVMLAPGQHVRVGLGRADLGDALDVLGEALAADTHRRT